MLAFAPMIRMGCVTLTTLFAFLPSALAQQPAPPAVVAQQPARSADDIARRTLDILSAPGALEKARYISFTFNVERDGKILASYPQRWDRFTGEYRVSGKTVDGLRFDVTLNVNTKKGHGSIGGIPVTDNTKFQELFAIGYRQFIADTTWLILPFELMYPGVHRTYDGQRTDSCGHTWDLLKLTFDENIVGLPVGDVYWLWINRDTGMVEEWDVQPVGRTDQRPLEVMLRAYQRVGGLLVSAQRDIRSTGQTIMFDDIKILPEVPKGAFE